MAHASTGRTASSPRGVVMIITIIALILLASLIFFVINSGLQVNRNVETQHTADVGAISGATWVARSMNTVAMNNVATTRLIAMTNVLDAMPQAVEFTLEDQTAAFEAVGDQVSGTNGRDRVIARWVREALGGDMNDDERLETQLQEEIDLLTPVDDLLNRSSFDIRETTFYDGPAGRGHAWRAMEALEAISLTAMDNVGTFAQVTAVTGADANSPESETFMLPLEPAIPWQHGAFNDWERPVRQGLLPTAIDDKVTHRGPWDTVLGYRRSVGGQSEGYWSSGDVNVAGGGRGSVPLGRGVSSRGQWTETSREPDAYAVWGPYNEMLRTVNGFRWSHLRHSRFNQWVRRISDTKLGYLWPGTDVRNIRDPEWITDFEEAAAIAEGNRSRIAETMFAVVEVRSTQPSSGNSLPGRWVYDGLTRGTHTRARIVRARGWVDPRDWQVPQMHDWVWRDEFEVQVWNDGELGLPPRTDIDGNRIPYTIWRVDDWVFLGVNVGDNVPIRNPHNFGSRANLPAPVDLDHSEVSPTPEDRLRHLSFFSVSSRLDDALIWRSRFRGAKPHPRMVKVAQAGVFNNHSFDLWTQMWQAQLEPVSDMPLWLDRLEVAADEAGSGGMVDSVTLEDSHDYLNAFRDVSQFLMRH